MSTSSFEDLRDELEEACSFLRSFTLGRQGFTQQDGVSGIQRVSDMCDRLKERFPTGAGFSGPPRPSGTRGGAGRPEARTTNDAHAARAPEPLKTFSLKNPSRQRSASRSGCAPNSLHAPTPRTRTRPGVPN